MVRYLLDTNLCIRVLRDRPSGVRIRFNAVVAELAVSSVVIMELLFGAEKSDRPDHHRREVDDLATRVQVLSYDTDAAAHTVQIRASLKRAGQTIGPYDAMIAGHARSRGLVVVTGNLGEFRRVDGLMCEDWLDPAN